MTASATVGRALRYAEGSARGLLHHHRGHGRVVRPRVIKIPQLTDDQLRKLEMPILVILGGRDALLDSRETRDRLSKAAPHAEVCFLEHGYHHLPNQSNRVMEFLKRSIPTVGA